MMQTVEHYESSSPEPGRRQLLLSAAALMSASALNSTVPLSWAQSATSPRRDGRLEKRMMGFMLPHEQFPVPELVELGIAAEAAGFDLLATSDHLQPWQADEGHSGQAWVTMAAIGQRTKSIWMGTTVTCPTFRYNPAVVAEGFASLNLLYPNRIFLGVGSGEALNEQAATGVWPNWQERSERLIEATNLIRKLWAGGQVSAEDKYYKVNAKLYDRPASPIPLLMAANGPKAMHRAGKYGDGLVTDPKTWKQHKPEFEAGLKEAGKNVGDVPVLVEHYAVVGGQKEAQAAAQLWRFGPKAFKTYYNVRDPQEIQARAEKEIPLEQVYADWAVGTDPAVHIQKVNALFDSGATIVNIHSGQPEQRKVIEFYGKQVLPKLKAAAAR